jgi:hypothetical protein
MVATETIQEQLRVVVTEALVSESTGTSTYEKMVSVARISPGVKNFLAETKEAEKRAKAEFSLTKMPSPWRSAKSVCASALSIGLCFVDENGSICGKTTMQNRIKDYKDAMRPITTRVETAIEAINKILRPFDNDSRSEILARVE